MSKEENKKDDVELEDLSLAEQAYYLGYGYYYGIKVDVDRERGLNLLKEAADLESVDAICALINIYEDEAGEDQDEREAVKWRERQVVVYKHIYGMSDERTMTAFGNLAYALCEAEEFERSREIGEPLLEMRSAFLGKTHPDTLTAMSNLAYVYGKLGDKRRACEMEEKLLDIRREMAGDKIDEDTLHTMNNLAVTYGQLGEHRRSYEMLEKVLDGRISLLGTEDPETLITMSNLAVAAAEIGENGRAVEMLEKVVEIRTRVLGYNHPDTAISRNNLGYVLCDLGEYERSLKIHTEIVARDGCIGMVISQNARATLNNLL